jgi:cytochrome c-type biogenesis protein CcmH
MWFWIAALALALGAAGFVARPVAFARRASRSRAAHDEQVFRDQLAEIGRDVERGILTGEEARAARIEISRRLLAAAAEVERAPDNQPAPRKASLALAAVLLIGAPLGGLALYDRIGAPGLPDQPFAAREAGARASQEVVEAGIRRTGGPSAPQEGGAEVASLIGQLEDRLKGDAPDRQGLYLLARAYAQTGNHAASWRSYRRLIGLSGGDAPAAVFGAMAEGMILAAGGYVSPEAEAALTQALSRDPASPVARYYMGAAFAQTGRAQSAMDVWTRLLRDSPADAPWIGATRAQIADLAERAGIAAPQVATAPAAPEGDAREAAAGMVARLEARLAADGGAPEEWAQLVRSLAVLGETDKAAAAAARARAALEGQPEALAAIDAALAAPAQALPGPGAADMAAAGGMEAGERDAMIRGMVGRLRDRLFAEGGAPEEWARLIHSYGVLGETDAATEAWTRAAAEHKDDPIALAFLKETALQAGGAPQ